jgi:peptidoglycan/LPS O-acetylase OafA/YrhL
VAAEPASPAASRLAYLDGLRGAALLLMVVNHTARWWVDAPMTWSRYALVYVTLTLAAPIFLFLVGFCLPLGLRGAEAPSLGALARRFVPRGARIVLAGLLLNLVVFPQEPVWSGGVLQTIGLAIAAMVPALWLLRWPAARWGLLLAAAGGYVSFALAFPALTRVVARHDLVGLVLFYDFPPWPWLSLVLVGLVLGWTWLEAHRESPAAGRRVMAALAVLGALLVAAFFVHDWWAATPVRFGMRRDFILNRHWTPRPAALLWVLGMVLLMLAVAYWAMERRRLRLPWLVLLGRTAMFLYFIHQVLAYTLVRQWLGWRFDTWPRFWVANALFAVLVIGLGWAWREIRGRTVGMWRPAPQPPG